MSMLLDSLLRTAIEPALSLLPPAMTSDKARLGLLAITLQEAEGIHRVQFGAGPAHGLWQFEEGGATRGVMTHPNSRDFARALCAVRRLPFDRHTVWEALPNDDILAAGFARLLLWTCAKPLPDLDAEGAWWDYYDDLWRPGKPRPKDWPKNFAQARAQVIA